MRHSVVCVVLFSACFQAMATDTSQPSQISSQKPGWLSQVRHRWSQIWYEGHPELYVTGYAWHNRYFYTPEKISTANYNELAYGGGLGKGFVDEDGDWHALYAMGFADSHRNLQPLAGYGFLKMGYLPHRFHVGGGFTWFVTQRQDIFHGIPFLGIPLPMVGVGADKLSIFATYVPGGTNIGNVLFVFAKWTL